jgi:hypothetical protein
MSPPAVPPARLVIPEWETLRELRHVLARGGLPLPHKRTAADSARIAAFRALTELLRLFEELRRRVEAGEHCYIVEREHDREHGRLVLELVIEVQR